MAIPNPRSGVNDSKRLDLPLHSVCRIKTEKHNITFSLEKSDLQQFRPEFEHREKDGYGSDDVRLRD